MGGFGRPFALWESHDMDDPGRRFEITERAEVPWLSVLLGYGPMMPLVAGAVLGFLYRGAARAEIILLTILWAGTILAFLAGVRRG